MTAPLLYTVTAEQAAMVAAAEALIAGEYEKHSFRCAVAATLQVSRHDDNTVSDAQVQQAIEWALS